MKLNPDHFSNVYCIFHSSDHDGHLSAALVKRKFPNAQLLPCNYDKKTPFNRLVPGKGSLVFMVDFSAPLEDIVRLNRDYNLVWIDHHTSAIEKMASISQDIDGMREVGVAGCELTWRYLYGTQPPYVVSLVGAYDTWRHEEYSQALPFFYGLSSYETFPVKDEGMALWSRLLNEAKEHRDDCLLTIIVAGFAIQKYVEKQNTIKAKSTCYVTEFEGYRCLTVNQGAINSKFFDSVWEGLDHDIMIGYSYRKGMWFFFLSTNKNDIDVSAIALKYGGGGHRGAAGFNLPEIPAELLMVKGLL